MPYDNKGKDHPRVRSKEVVYDEYYGEYYHVTAPGAMINSYYYKMHPRLPMHTRIRHYITKHCMGQKGERVDAIMAWAKKRGFSTGLKCEKSGVWCERTAVSTIHTKGPRGGAITQYWSNALCTSDATYRCRNSGNRYDSAAYPPIRVVEYGEFSSPDYVGRYYKWADGTYHIRSQEEQERILREQAEERARQEEQRAQRIPSYHSTQTEWRQQTVTKGEILFGVELEVKAKDKDRSMKVRKEIYDEVVKTGFIGETDGSLCGYRGIEIVGKPLAYNVIRGKESPWLGLLDKIKPKCDREAGTGYGMHISVSRGVMTQAHQIRFIHFISKTKKLCERVGERQYEFYEKPLEDLDRVLRSHRDAASPQGDHRIEVRIFKSVINKKDFLRNVEFTASTVEYTRDCDNKDLNEDKFLKWLKDGREKNYPNLSVFLKGLVKPVPVMAGYDDGDFGDDDVSFDPEEDDDNSDNGPF